MCLPQCLQIQAVSLSGALCRTPVGTSRSLPARGSGRVHVWQEQGDLCTCGDPERWRLCSVSQASAMFVSGSFSISGDFLQSLEISLGYCRGWFPFSRCV